MKETNTVLGLITIDTDLDYLAEVSPGFSFSPLTLWKEIPLHSTHFSHGERERCSTSFRVRYPQITWNSYAWRACLFFPVFFFMQLFAYPVIFGYTIFFLFCFSDCLIFGLYELSQLMLAFLCNASSCCFEVPGYFLSGSMRHFRLSLPLPCKTLPTARVTVTLRTGSPLWSLLSTCILTSSALWR